MYCGDAEEEEERVEQSKCGREGVGQASGASGQRCGKRERVWAEEGEGATRALTDMEVTLDVSHNGSG